METLLLLEKNDESRTLLESNRKRPVTSDTDSIPSNCPCNLITLERPKIYEKELNQWNPWYNLTTWGHLAKHHPNFPVTITRAIMKERCHLMPAPHNIEWRSKYWQYLNVNPNTSYYLYSAFIDNRVLTKVRPCVRILVNTKTQSPRDLWCYLWFGASQPPVLAQVTRVEYLCYKKVSSKFYKTFLLTCPLPPEAPKRKPDAVSLVAKPCDSATNLLEVGGAMERDERKAFRAGKRPNNNVNFTSFNVAACGTALYYYTEDFSTRLVEWLEILRAMGFSQVFLHETDVHPNIKRVLQHYEEEGFIAVTHFSYPDPYINEPSIRKLWHIIERSKRIAMEVVFFADCVLRHMHEYRFIAHLDPDEVPMFFQFDSYLSYMDFIIGKAAKKAASLGRPLPASYEAFWRYHAGDLPISKEATDLPEYYYILRHTNVPKKGIYGYYRKVKSLYDMDTVTGVRSHEVETCASGKCYRKVFVPPSVSYIGHYKTSVSCGKQCKKPGSYVEVPVLLQYKDQVEEAVTKVLKKLEII